MSTVARKAKNDIEFIEGEALRSNKPVDWQHCEAMIGLFVVAVAWIQKASDPLVASDADAYEELIGHRKPGREPSGFQSPAVRRIPG